jgi:hypothetical protein
MRGLKEDMEEWKGTLTAEERDLVEKQAKLEFDKAFRKSDEYKKDLPEDKIAGLGKVLKKFYESEYAEAIAEKKKEERKVTWDPYEIAESTSTNFTFDLTGEVIEIDRDAMRRYRHTHKYYNMKKEMRVPIAERQGTGAPRQAWIKMPNNETGFHDLWIDWFKGWKSQIETAGPVQDYCKKHPQFEAGVRYWTDAPDFRIPPVGEDFFVLMPEMPFEIFMYMNNQIKGELKDEITAKCKEDMSASDFEEWQKKMDDDENPDGWQQTVDKAGAYLLSKWERMNKETWDKNEWEKKFYADNFSDDYSRRNKLLLHRRKCRMSAAREHRRDAVRNFRCEGTETGKVHCGQISHTRRLLRKVSDRQVSSSS